MCLLILQAYCYEHRYTGIVLQSEDSVYGIWLNLWRANHTMSHLLTHTSLFMLFTVLHFVMMIIIAVVKRSIYILLFAPLVGALMGCDGANNIKASQLESKASTFLPDGSAMLFIESVESEGLGRQLSLLNVATEKHRVLYSANSSNDLRMRQPIWGDLDCVEPVQFSPQSFDLAQRPSGRWQLLLANQRAEDVSHSPDTVEMFELQKNDIQEWVLIWRGCVEIPASIVFHHVQTLQEGFLLIPSLTFFEKIVSQMKAVIGYKANKKWRWRLRDGLQLISIR